MRAFLFACVAALLLGIGAAYVLSQMPDTTQAAFSSSPSVRI